MIVCPVQLETTGFGVTLRAFRMDDDDVGGKRGGALSWYHDDAQLPPGAVPIHQPERFDVLLGRGRGHVSNPGNKRLQIAVNMHKDRYNSPSTSRAEKTKITTDIVHFIKSCGGEQGRFLKYHGIMGCWFEVEDEVARLKVSQALRYTRRSTNSFGMAGGEDQESVTSSRSSQFEPEPLAPEVSSSSMMKSDKKKAPPAPTPTPARVASSSRETRPSSDNPPSSRSLLLDYDNGSALDPIGPDFEW